MQNIVIMCIIMYSIAPRALLGIPVKSSILYMAVLALMASLGGCGKVDYNPVALGFADKAEMEAAFAKGYHTKQMLLEMLPPPPEVKPEAAQFVQAVQEEQPVQPQSSQETSTLEPEKLAGDPKLEAAVSNDAHVTLTCTDVLACVNAMLASAKVENLTAAMDVVRRIDGFQKPERGDRRTARKFNDEGLSALKQGRSLDAINLLTKARETDGLDEEILDNLVFAYAKNGSHAKAVAIASEGLGLNPRRASLWVNYSQANAEIGNQAAALQAMWLAWQFSPNKEKTLKFIEKKILDEKDAAMQSYYKASKAWLVENKKPKF
ncbi:hypothetical protein [Malikia spinosa]|jgi:tetratricopeptide (TPR) repeat protein|uniref:hypothetical protein n=1 Tax=Malikia spinosa TaxID=86180 RepID=UPI003FA234CA